MLEGNSVLERLSFGLSPTNISDSLAEKPDDERIVAFDLVRINGEELRNPVRHDLFELLSGNRSNKRPRSKGSSRSSRSNRENTR